MKTVFYKTFIKNLLTQKINIDTDSFKVALLKTNYVFDSSETSYKNIKAYEVSEDNTGYISGGKNISLKMVASPDNDFIYVTGNNVSWDNFSSTFRYVVIYKDNGDLVCCVDFENNNTINNAQLSIEWGVSGIFKFILE